MDHKTGIPVLQDLQEALSSLLNMPFYNLHCFPIYVTCAQNHLNTSKYCWMKQNNLSQTLHLLGFSPVWVLMCLLSKCRANLHEQTTHGSEALLASDLGLTTHSWNVIGWNIPIMPMKYKWWFCLKNNHLDVSSSLIGWSAFLTFESLALIGQVVVGWKYNPMINFDGTAAP